MNIDRLSDGECSNSPNQDNEIELNYLKERVLSVTDDRSKQPKLLGEASNKNTTIIELIKRSNSTLIIT